LRTPRVEHGRGVGKHDSGRSLLAQPVDKPAEIGRILAHRGLLLARLACDLQIVQPAIEVHDHWLLADGHFCELLEQVGAVAAVGRRADHRGPARQTFGHERRIAHAHRIAEQHHLGQWISGRQALGSDGHRTA